MIAQPTRACETGFTDQWSRGTGGLQCRATTSRASDQLPQVVPSGRQKPSANATLSHLPELTPPDFRPVGSMPRAFVRSKPRQHAGGRPPVSNCELADRLLETRRRFPHLNSRSAVVARTRGRKQRLQRIAAELEGSGRLTFVGTTPDGEI